MGKLKLPREYEAWDVLPRIATFENQPHRLRKLGNFMGGRLLSSYEPKFDFDRTYEMIEEVEGIVMVRYAFATISDFEKISQGMQPNSAKKFLFNKVRPMAYTQGLNMFMHQTYGTGDSTRHYIDFHCENDKRNSVIEGTLEFKL